MTGLGLTDHRVGNVFKCAAKRCGMGIAAVALSSAGLAQDGHFPLRYVDLIHETYFNATPANRGLVHRLEWTEVRARVNDQWLFQVTHTQMINRSFLDETYLQFEGPNYFVRGGKMRSGFGFGSWSDLWYNVTARLPMIRFMPILDRYSLIDFGSGLEVQGYQDGIEYRASVTDSSLGARDLVPRKADLAQARVQVPVGQVQVGVNFADVAAGDLGQGGNLYGIDYWWSQNRWTVKGEVIASKGPGQTSSGYYTDLSYRVTHPLRPQLGLRFEEVEVGGFHSSLVTAGVRVLPTPNLALTLNYGFDSPTSLLSPGSAGYAVVPPSTYGYSEGLRGWSFQVMYALRFRL